MSIHQQHERFVRDIRSGRAHASDLEDRYEPYTTSFGCLEHMFIDDDKCEGCGRRAREREEDRQVDRYRKELWREQRYYDQEQAAEKKADDARQEKKDQKDAERQEARDERRAERQDERAARKAATPGVSAGSGAGTLPGLHPLHPMARKVRKNRAQRLERERQERPKGYPRTAPVTLHGRTTTQAAGKGDSSDRAQVHRLPTVAGTGADAGGNRGGFAGLVVLGLGAGVLYFLICVVAWVGRTYFGWI